MPKFRVTSVIVVSLFLATLSWAQNQAPLTADVVESFIASMHDMEEISKNYEDSGFMGQDLSNAAEMLQKHEAYNEVVTMINNHGFPDVQLWAAVGNQVMKAFAANKLGEEMPAMDEEMQKAVEEIQKSQMSDTQKQQMIEMLQSSQQIIDAYSDVPEADKAAVLPFMSSIDALSRN